MTLRASFIALIVASGFFAQAQTPSKRNAQCPDFDIEGLWDNTHGQQFRITQRGCREVSLIRVPHKGETPNDFTLTRPIVFHLNGNTKAEVSSASFTGLTHMKGDAEKILKDTLDHQTIYSRFVRRSPNMPPRIDVAAQGDLGIPGLAKDTYHIFTYTYLASITPSSFGFSVSFGPDGKPIYSSSPINGLSLRTEKLEMNDIKSNYGATIANVGGVLYGANLILNLVAPEISADLIRIK